jgi:hypothetical protein
MKIATKILMQQILDVTLKINRELPELYNLLHETPIISSKPDYEISNEECKEYLESLQLELKFFTK